MFNNGRWRVGGSDCGVIVVPDWTNDILAQVLGPDRLRRVRELGFGATPFNNLYTPRRLYEFATRVNKFVLRLYAWLCRWWTWLLEVLFIYIYNLLSNRMKGVTVRYNELGCTSGWWGCMLVYIYGWWGYMLVCICGGWWLNEYKYLCVFV